MQQNPKPIRRVRVERGIYRNPSTGGYEIEFTDATGRVRWRRIYGGLRDARLARAEVQTRLGRGDPVARSRRTFADVGEEWLTAQTHLRKRTHSLYSTALRRHLVPRLGGMRIAEVDEDAIARAIADLQASGLSASTVQGILTPLGRILNHAARRGLIADNPMSRLERRERPRVERREMRILNSEEIDAVLRVATPAYRNVLATAVFTGLRQSELLGLTWADVDLDAGIVRVRRQLDRGGGYSEPKTPRAKRDVVLMPSLVTLLSEHKLASTYSRPADPVFVTRTGRPLYYRNLIRGLRLALAKAGLDGDGQPRLRFHDLRHTYASLLIAQGLNIAFIGNQLGHASPSFTLHVYGGLFDRAEHASRARDRLEAAFGEMLTAT
jgi:integrase